MHNTMRATIFRLTALYTVIFSIGILLFGGMWWFNISSDFHARFENKIKHESALLSEIERHYGINALISALDNPTYDQNHFVYALFDSKQKPVVGNLPYPENINQEHWVKYKLPDLSDDAETEEWHGYVTKFDSGTTLIVADNFELYQDLLEDLIENVILLFVAVILISVAAGAFVTRHFLARLSAFNLIIKDVSSGDVSKRVPISGIGDEFDSLSQEVNQMLESIEKLTSNLRQVSTDIAHDLRTALSHVYRDIEQANNDLPDNPTKAQAHLERSAQDAQNLLDVFAAMLRLAEIESGQTKKSFKKVDLAKLVEDVTNAYLPSYDEASHQLFVDALPGQFIQGDADLLRQMLANLLENGLQHTSTGTVHNVKLESGINDGEIVLSISDNGDGIPEEEKANVLKRFYRLSKSRGTEGSGLGMALVNAICHLHNAELVLGNTQPGLLIKISFEKDTKQ